MNPFTKIMNGNKSYTANFAINTYTLAVNASPAAGGSVSRNPSQATYNHGTSVQVTATPAVGYSFTGWSGDTTGTMNPFTKIMNGNKTYTANFAINTYTLAVNASPAAGGSVSRNPSQATYNHGTSVQVTATPAVGYTFTSWSGDTTGTNNPFTVVMNGNKSYTANLALNSYTLAVNTVGNGVTKNPDQPGFYTHGTSKSSARRPRGPAAACRLGSDTTGTEPFTKIANSNKSHRHARSNTYTLATRPAAAAGRSEPSHLQPWDVGPGDRDPGSATRSPAGAATPPAPESVHRHPA
jgi:uncharacterized repeat protein (TIGR02543 family)